MSQLAIHSPIDRASDWDRNPRGLPGEDREAQLLWRLRYHTTKTQLRQLFTEARLRTGLVIGLSIFFWCGLFELFYKGFEFVVQQIEAPGATYHAQTMR